MLLYPDEVDRIRARTDELNAVIANVGGAAGAIEFDVHAFFSGVAATGYHIGGLSLTTTFGSGGIFSADGFHPNDVGQAIVADEIVKTINAHSATATPLPEPDLFAVFFTPDVPPGSSAAVTSPGLEYSQELLRQLYGIFPAVTAGISVQEARGAVSRPNPGTNRPTTRTLERPADRSR